MTLTNLKLYSANSQQTNSFFITYNILPFFGLNKSKYCQPPCDECSFLCNLKCEASVCKAVYLKFKRNEPISNFNLKLKKKKSEYDHFQVESPSC